MSKLALPEPKPYHDYLGLFDKGEAIGHNNCLREVARLNSSPASAVDDDEYIPAGLVEAITHSQEVDAVGLAVKSLKPVNEQPSQVNDWFLALPPERQAVLREDKWLLADAAFKAGQATLREELTDIKLMFEFVEGRPWLRSDAAVYVYEKLKELLDGEPT